MKPDTVHAGAGLRSMRARMTALFALLVALLMLVAGVAVQRREIRRAQRQLDNQLDMAVIRTKDELAEAPPKRPLIQVIRDSQGELSEGGIALLVVDKQGQVPWQSRRPPLAWPLPDYWHFRTVSEGNQTVILARSWLPLGAELRERAMVLAELGLVMVVATAALAWFVVGTTLSPLDKLANQARDASIESLQVRLESPSSDSEMRHLTATLNVLLRRLEDEARARGRFYAAASHELRTPIQVLLGQIDVARSRPRTIEEHELVLAQVQSHTERLATLVQDLLQLNALEMGQNAAPPERLNLAFWVERALAAAEPERRRQNLQLQSEIEDTVVDVPSSHLEVIVRNLLENAVKYATPGSTLQVKVQAVGGSAEIRMWNAAELAPSTDPTTWFEPFYRPDASRNSRTGGNGLGLAIAAAIVHANRWNLDLSVENGGISARLSVRMPEAATENF